ncbi:unnamed protein product, partial [Nesidiocoris tenuis]
MTRVNTDTLDTLIREHDWSLVLGTEDPNTAAENLVGALKSLIDEATTRIR